MHEMSIITSVFSLIETKIDSNKKNKITTIRLNVGKFSNAVPSSLEFAFSTLKKGTIFENAELIINAIELKCLCLDCKEEMVMTDHRFTCYSCSGNNLKITSGRELFLDSVDVEEI